MTIENNSNPRHPTDKRMPTRECRHENADKRMTQSVAATKAVQLMPHEFVNTAMLTMVSNSSRRILRLSWPSHNAGYLLQMPTRVILGCGCSIITLPTAYTMPNLTCTIPAYELFKTVATCPVLHLDLVLTVPSTLA